MSNSEFGLLTLLLFFLVTLAHLLGDFFVRLRQPRVLGEICAGLLLGPSLLGQFAPKLSASILPPDTAGSQHGMALSFLYQLGLLLLMFVSGAESRARFTRHDSKSVSLLVLLGTGLPFCIALAVAPFFPLDQLAGSSGPKTPLLLVIGIAIAVTSIPVISKILHDLGILHTRFARLVLGVAVIEDVGLWAVLAVATALAKSGSIPHGEIVSHVVVTLVYFSGALVLAPPLLRRLTHHRWNVLAANAPVAYVVVVLLAYAALAASLGVSLIFAAFLAGLALGRDESLAEPIRQVTRISFALFVPVYFAIVGYKLDLAHQFSFRMLAGFLVFACVVKIISAMLGARVAGFSNRDSVNLAVALNARGGPGIVLASVALEAAIISPTFYTTLVLVAVLTSQMAGVWLAYLLRNGLPLLTAQAEPGERVLADASTEKTLAA